MEDADRVLVQVPFPHFDEGSLEEIEVGVDLLLLPLIEAFALFRCFVGSERVDVAQELRHLYEISAWLPVFPANFASREESSKVKGEKKETFSVLLQKTTFRIELSFLSLLLYL